MPQSLAHRRKHIRLREYDYSQAGAYFVTICTKDRVHYFGEVVKEQMNQSVVGKIADKCWKELPEHVPNIQLDEFVVMPNHMHGIVCILDIPGRDVRTNIPTNNYHSRISPQKGSLGVIVRTYKAAVTTLCRRNGIHGFGWQSGYFDHIIRDDKSLNRIRNYIATNPQQWWCDKENAQRKETDRLEQWLEVEGQKAIKAREMV